LEKEKKMEKGSKDKKGRKKTGISRMEFVCLFIYGVFDDPVSFHSVE
jgi:hypothetical protein